MAKVAFRDGLLTVTRRQKDEARVEHAGLIHPGLG